MDLNTVLVCGVVQKVIHIRDNGNLANLKVMEFILGQMAIITKVNLNNAWNMAKGFKNLQMETCTKEDM
jgi:hypothetical protein